jgi:hypothetical protein
MVGQDRIERWGQVVLEMEGEGGTARLGASSNRAL